MHVVQSDRKSGVILIKHSRDMTTVEPQYNKTHLADISVSRMLARPDFRISGAEVKNIA